MGSSSSVHVFQDATDVDVEKMSGTWFVVKSNLDFWKPGPNARRNPRITYELMSPNRLKDTVTYEEGKKTKTVVGIDTADSSAPGKWKWRGIHATLDQNAFTNK
eukprot:TRINITY_DN2035_c0_g1_i1.p1 TRINITY_DN2035_c0_g1~~TRINITY_DN2035_c0_g1_i1.p1  ORF type:complete len:104 (+),score=9.16 TRINITY_DN2035_c0_g1_i1:196-507(+)